jgi:parallel beta-helix repeat protein
MGGGEGDVVKDCVADYNGGDGFNVGMAFPGRGTVITGCEAKRNVDDGIEVSSYCVVRGNNVLTNGMSGIHVAFTGTGNRIEDNHSSLQFTGYLLDPPTFANLVIKNSSQGNGVGYVVPPGNHAAAITAFPGLGFVGAGPWTNFDY